MAINYDDWKLSYSNEVPKYVGNNYEAFNTLRQAKEYEFNTVASDIAGTNAQIYQTYQTTPDYQKPLIKKTYDAYTSKLQDMATNGLKTGNLSPLYGEVNKLATQASGDFGAVIAANEQRAKVDNQLMSIQKSPDKYKEYDPKLAALKRQYNLNLDILGTQETGKPGYYGGDSYIPKKVSEDDFWKNLNPGENSIINEYNWSDNPVETEDGNFKESKDHKTRFSISGNYFLKKNKDGQFDIDLDATKAYLKNAYDNSDLSKYKKESYAIQLGANGIVNKDEQELNIEQANENDFNYIWNKYRLKNGIKQTGESGTKISLQNLPSNKDGGNGRAKKIVVDDINVINDSQTMNLTGVFPTNTPLINIPKDDSEYKKLPLENELLNVLNTALKDVTRYEKGEWKPFDPATPITDVSTLRRAIVKGVDGFIINATYENKISNTDYSSTTNIKPEDEKGREINKNTTGTNSRDIDKKNNQIFIPYDQISQIAEDLATKAQDKVNVAISKGTLTANDAKRYASILTTFGLSSVMKATKYSTKKYSEIIEDPKNYSNQSVIYNVSKNEEFYQNIEGVDPDIVFDIIAYYDKNGRYELGYKVHAKSDSRDAIALVKDTNTSNPTLATTFGVLSKQAENSPNYGTGLKINKNIVSSSDIIVGSPKDALALALLYTQNLRHAR